MLSQELLKQMNSEQLCFVREMAVTTMHSEWTTDRDKGYAEDLVTEVDKILIPMQVVNVCMDCGYNYITYTDQKDEGICMHCQNDKVDEEETE